MCGVVPVEGDVEVEVLNQNIVGTNDAQGKHGVIHGGDPDGRA